MYRHIKNYEIRYTDVDFSDNLKLSALLSLLEESACLSAEELGFGYSVLQPNNLGFVLVNWFVELERPIRLGDALAVHTWPLKPKKMIVFRDYELYVGDEKVGVATSRWCIINLKTGEMCPTTMVFNDSMTFNENRSVDEVNFKVAELNGVSPCYTKIISYSDYDHYNHANNTKYADFLMDAFTVKDMERKNVTSVRITYVKQCKSSDVLQMSKEKQKDGSWIVEGRVDGELRVQMQVAFDTLGVKRSALGGLLGGRNVDKTYVLNTKSGKVKYTIKRSVRSSYSVRITEDNSIVVSCPRTTTDAEVKKFLETKSNWIEQHLAVNKLKNEFLSEVIGYKKILVRGKSVPLTVKSNAEESFSNEGVVVKNYKSLKKLYINNLGPRFLDLFKMVAAHSKFTYSKVGFKDLKTCWGSCTSDGEITFNYKILMLSDEYWLYVIVHELCHTVHADHSVEFYKLAEKIMPEYKIVMRDIELYSRITKLY